MYSDEIDIINIQGKLWIRKDTMDGFHIEIGAPGSAGASDPVGFYMLNKLNEIRPERNRALHKDDGLF